MKFVFSLLAVIQSVLISGQITPYVFHKKLSTWGTEVTGMESLNLMVAFSSDEKTMLAAGEAGALVIWDLKKGIIKCDLTDSNKLQIYDVAYSPDGKYFILAGNQNLKKSIAIWDAQKYRIIKTLVYDSTWEDIKLKGGLFKTRNIFSVIFSADAKYIISGDGDGLLSTWEVGSWRLVSTIDTKDQQIWEISTDRNGEYIGSSSQNGFIKIWKLDNGYLTFIKSVKLINSDKFTTPTSISISTNQLICANNYDTLKMVDLQNNTAVIVDSLNDPYNFINAVSFSSEGYYLASGYKYNDIKIWSTDSNKLVQTIQGDIHNEFQNEDGYNDARPLFSPTSKYLALINNAWFIYIYKRR